MSINRRGIYVGLWLIVVAAAAVFVAARFAITTDISEFLPEPESREQASIAREIATGELSRRMIVTIETDSDAHAIAASRALETRLRSDEALRPLLESVTGGPPQNTDEAIWTLYHERRFAFVAPTAEKAREQASDEALRESAAHLRKMLEQPLSAVISRVAPADPLLILPGLFDRFGSAQAGSIRLADGRFLSAEGHFAVLFLKSRAAAFDSSAQQKLLTRLDAVFADFAASVDYPTTVEMSGVNRFAVAAKRTIERDIRRISIASAIGLGLLLLTLFRSVRVLGLAFIPIGAGVLVGIAVTLLVFGRIHGITLAFGAALIGVAVDYVIHIYCHHLLTNPGGSPYDSAAKITPALVMGAATTMAGFVALAFSAFGGLQQVAIFALAGLAMALVTARFVVPGIVPTAAPEVHLRRALLDRLSELLTFFRDRRWAGYALLGVAFAITAVAAPFVRWSHQLVELGELDPALMRQEEAVRARVSRFDQTRFIVARGETKEDALQRNDAVSDALRDDLPVESFSSIRTFLPSAKRQRAVAGAFLEAPDLRRRFASAFEAAGFNASAFEPFYEALNAGVPTPLTYAMLAHSELAPAVESFHLPVAGDEAFITFLHGVDDPAALERTFGPMKGVSYLDQNVILEQAGVQYQRRTVELLLIGVLAVLLLLFARYRSFLHTLAVSAPALLSVGVTIALLTVAGEAIDLVVLTALLMVVSMGVDYGVFLVDAREHGPSELSAAMLSIVVAALSTLLGFGLLALSDYPILFRIGLTAAIGVSAAMVLAPVSLTILGSEDS